MRSTGTHRHDRGRQGNYGSYAPRGAPMYYGWSHDESRMQMMDLPDYLDSFRLGYERALGDLQSQLAGLTQAYAPQGNVMYGYAPSGPYQPQPGGRGQPHGGHHPHHDHDCGCECHDHHGHHGHEHHGHGHHDHRGHGCGCGHYDDCRCDCCIVDADYVVYARCLERRVVPIQIDNDTRKPREDVTLEVSEVRSSGGRVLPWKVRVNPQSPITLAACSTTEIDLLVEIECGDQAQQPEPQQTPGRRPRRRRRLRRRRPKPRTPPPRTRSARAPSSPSTSTTARSATSPFAWAVASSDPSSWRSPCSPATATPTTRRARAAAAEGLPFSRCRR